MIELFIFNHKMNNKQKINIIFSITRLLEQYLIMYCGLIFFKQLLYDIFLQTIFIIAMKKKHIYVFDILLRITNIAQPIA